MLEIQDLVKVYKNKNKKIRAIDEISFKIKEGEAVGILGPNGAGKTTTIKCICDLIIPTSGMITLNGVDTLKHPSLVASSISAVLEGNRNIYWRLTTEQNLEFFAGLMGKKVKKDRMDELIKNFDLTEKEKRRRASYQGACSRSLLLPVL
jgi:ABC-type Na+ transport system, ATPase component